MPYSTEYLAVIVNILSFVLPQLGVNVGSEALTTTLQTLVTVGSGLYLLLKRYKRGGVSVAGFRN